jgi:hypothetical protein
MAMFTFTRAKGPNWNHALVTPAPVRRARIDGTGAVG